MMKLTSKYLLAFMICVMGVQFQAQAAGEEQEAALKKHKLSLFGNTWILDAEKPLIKAAGLVRRDKAAYDREVRSYKSFERSIRTLKKKIAYGQYQMDKLENQAEQPQTLDDYKRLTKKIAELKAQIKILTERKSEKEAEAQAKVDKAQLKYLDNVKVVAPKLLKLKASYAELSRNKEVTGAIEAYNTETKRKTELGPSTVIESNMRFIEQVSKDIKSGEIELRKESNILWIEVMLNGKGTRSMVLDTGASSVMLPSDFAAEVGLVPSVDTPTVRLQQADGTIVEGKSMTLKSVKVGQFVVENVPCVVLEEKAIAAEPLLGGTFLKHFIYRIDPDRGRLMMTRKSGSDDDKSKD